MLHTTALSPAHIIHQVHLSIQTVLNLEGMVSDSEKDFNQEPEFELFGDWLEYFLILL
jgi:hypothetical protein